MKLTVAAGALLLSTAFAAPIAERQAAITDVDILQFALTVCSLFLHHPWTALTPLPSSSNISRMSSTSRVSA